MPVPVHNKYYLRTLHEEIDLFDRKLAHMQKYDLSASEAERTTSRDKMVAKRELLVRTARQLVSEGIEFKSSELPRSFREGEAEAEVVPEAEVAAEVPAFTATAKSAVRPSPSPFAGTVLDGQAGMQEYKRQRAKAARS